MMKPPIAFHHIVVDLLMVFMLGISRLLVVVSNLQVFFLDKTYKGASHCFSLWLIKHFHTLAQVLGRKVLLCSKELGEGRAQIVGHN